MKNALVYLALVLGSLTYSSSSYAQQDWMNTICSFWLKGKYLGEDKCMVAWGASKVMAITYLAGETPGKGIRETIRPYEDGWIYGRKSECLLYPPTGYAICQKTPGHRFNKDYLMQ